MRVSSNSTMKTMIVVDQTLALDWYLWGIQGVQKKEFLCNRPWESSTLDIGPQNYKIQRLD